MIKTGRLRAFSLLLLLIINITLVVASPFAEEEQDGETPNWESYINQSITYLYPSQERHWYVTPLLSVNVYNLSIGGGFIYYHDNVFNRGYLAEVYNFLGASGFQNHYLNLYKNNPLSWEFDLTLNLGYQYSHEYFYGFGPDTVAAEKDYDNHDEGVYRIKQGQARLLAGYNLPYNSKLELGYQWKSTRIHDDFQENLTNVKQIDKLTGIDGGLSNNLVTRFSYNLYKTRKDIAAASLKGYYMLQLAAPEVDSDYTFNKHTCNIKGLVNFPGRKYYSLTRANVKVINGRKEEIPFYEYPVIGGIDTVRGLQDNRYTDHIAVFSSQEFFYQLNDNVLASLFVDSGRVFPDRESVNLAGYQRAWGGSFNCQILRLFSLTLTLAKAEDRQNLAYYFSATDAF